MKKTSALLAGALPLALILAGCAQIEEAAGNVTGNHSYSKNLTVDGKVDAADGSYSTIKVSDDFLNKNVNAGPADGKPFAKVINPDTGEQMDDDPQLLSQKLRSNIIPFFFDEFIDSTALEGGEPTLTAWKAKKIADGSFSTTPTTKKWLDGSPELSLPVLTADRIVTTGGLKFIHDGKPRMADANITFGEVTWGRNEDGDAYYKVASEWSVDYRVTDATVAEMLKVMNKATDEDVKNVLTDEAKDGTGENKLHFSGPAFWYLMASGDSGQMPLYYASSTSAFSLNPFIKPEFQRPAPSTPAAP